MFKPKFRGKCLERNKWYYGDFVSDIREYNRTCDKNYIVPHWDKLNSPISVDDGTVGQFTHLYDKHKNEIYYHDLVRTRDSIGFVEFKDGCFVVVWEKGPYYEHYLHEVSARCEVVGNKTDGQTIE